MSNPAQRIRLRYDDSESGWGVLLSSTTARLTNIPLADDLCIDDTVEIGSAEDTWRPIVRVLDRVWPMKSTIDYEPDSQEAWVAVSTAIRESGLGWTEGWVAGRGAVCHSAELTQDRLNQFLAGTSTRATLSYTYSPPRRGTA